MECVSTPGALLFNLRFALKKIACLKIPIGYVRIKADGGGG